jgi:hypothetical protein
MYKVEINLGWDEVVTIETDDFNKVVLLQEFIVAQEEAGWSEGEDNELLSFTDTDGTTWYYDEEEDEWLELEEDEEDEET